jgi:hypothetical protein
MRKAPALLVVLASCSSGNGGVEVGSTPVAEPTPTEQIAATVIPTEPEAATTTTVASTTRIVGSLTAAQVAAELTAVEQAAARGDGSVGVRQQLLYRYLSAHPDLDDAVLAAIGADVRPIVERVVRARQFGQARQAADTTPPAPSPTLPAWTIVDPAPTDELLADYRAAEAATGIAWYWLAAIHLQETRMGRIIGVSSAGAVGPMQFLPETWARCCTGDPTVTSDAIIGAADYLAQSGGPGDMAAALHVYNPNDSYVATVTAFAENLRDDPQLYAAYHEWQVFVASAAGTVRLPVGYSETQPVDAVAYLADHPGDAAG